MPCNTLTLFEKKVQVSELIQTRNDLVERCWKLQMDINIEDNVQKQEELTYQLNQLINYINEHHPLDKIKSQIKQIEREEISEHGFSSITNTPYRL